MWAAFPRHVAGLLLVLYKARVPLQNRVSPFGELFATPARAP